MARKALHKRGVAVFAGVRAACVGVGGVVRHGEIGFCDDAPRGDVFDG